MTTAATPQATVAVPFDLLSTLTALAGHAADSPEQYVAHEVRDALAELHDDLDLIEVATVEAWGGDLERRTAEANEMVEELMGRAGHG